jgi:hypothetical protein
MAIVTCIVGLCGSGKSWLATDMHSKNGVPFLDEQFPNDSAKEVALFGLLHKNQDCIYTHLALCRRDYRDAFMTKVTAIFPGTVFKWICFKNDLLKCNANLWGRPKADVDGHAQINLNYWLLYTYPDGADIREVWNDPSWRGPALFLP